MAITVEMRTQVSQLYVALFGRAPDGEGLGYWVKELDSGKSIANVANAMYSTTPAQSLYPAYLTNAEIIDSFYTNVLGRPADTDPEGRAFWTSKLNDPDATPGSVIAEMIDTVANYNGSDYDGLTSADLFNNKVEVAQWYGETIGDLAGATTILANVTEDPTTIDAAKESTVPVQPPYVSHYALSTAADALQGGAGDDTFTARVAQNVNGEQTNQLATGDAIDGGAGTDTLNAKLQMASALNQAPASAIAPETVDVENINITALTANNANSPAPSAEGVTLNAKDMLGVDQIASVQSDASLVVENLTTLTDSGAYAARRETGAITIRMDHTGNDMAVDLESDFTVLFDNDYLIPTGTNQSVANYWLLDEDADLAGISNRLNQIDVNGLSFTIDGQVYNVSAVANPVTDLYSGSHADFVAKLQTDLAKQQAEGNIPDYISISLDTNNTRTTGLENGALSGPIPAIVVASTGGVVVPRGFNRPEDATGQYDVYGRFDNNASSTSLITSNIELDKVGRGAEGGELIVGGMATDGANVWDYSDSARAEGVERFNVTVLGDATQNSSLASLKSTNNTLQEVYVEAADGSLADLYLGNHNTAFTADGASLKDVRVFDASTFTNDVFLTRAQISNEAVAKYMDLTDDTLDPNGIDPAADNVDFIYSFGVGNDQLGINIDKSNLARVGSTTREDFTFTANMGDGDDNATVGIGDGNATSNLDPWYVNSTFNKNLDINAGAGDDIVTTQGSGTWQIDMGTGSDTVYSDNAGNDAVWVFNTYHNALDGAGTVAARQLENLRSSDNTTFGSLFKTELAVNFRGITSTIELGAEVNTDLELNQYIKTAINSDEVLSKLLLAEDGPANTLVVRSQIDGAVVAGDLALSFVAPTAAQFSQADINTYAAEYNVSAATLSPAALQTLVAANLAGFNLTNDYASNLANVDGTVATEILGSNSTQVSESTITVNLDQTDVIVLSTGAASAEHLILEGTEDNEPLVVVNYDAANDTIQYRSASGLENTRVNVDQIEIWDTAGAQWVSVATVDFATATGGVTPPPPPTPGTTNPITLNPNDTDIAATSGDDVITFNLGAAQNTAGANTQIDLTGFDTANDILKLDLTTPGNTTLDLLDGVDGIDVVPNPFAAGGPSTLVTFGPDMEGDVIALTLVGITDASQVQVQVV